MSCRERLVGTHKKVHQQGHVETRPSHCNLGALAVAPSGRKFRFLLETRRARFFVISLSLLFSADVTPNDLGVGRAEYYFQ